MIYVDMHAGDEMTFCSKRIYLMQRSVNIKVKELCRKTPGKSANIYLFT